MVMSTSDDLPDRNRGGQSSVALVESRSWTVEGFDHPKIVRVASVDINELSPSWVVYC